jgi:iron(III) transport system substrate-binding protein
MRRFLLGLHPLLRAGLAAASAALALQAAAQNTEGPVLNLYSARHYSTDEALYANFTKATGIRIQRVDADDAGILARLAAEGSASPADVVLLVDAARLARAEQSGLFLPIRSALLDAAIPARYRAAPAANGGTAWFGFSTRARLVVYDKRRLRATDVDTYEKLGGAALKGQLCVRSGSHPYNLSLFGAVLQQMGPERTEAWLKALVGNMARSPKGGDTDQIKGVASGECGVALTNSYYMARLLRSTSAEDKTIVERVGVVFPDQAGAGTHVNIAGGGVARYAKHTAEAQKFLEYLASAAAQNYFADGNNEWPIVPSVVIENTALKAMVGGNGSFKADSVPVAVLGANQSRVQQMLDRVGFK